mgnify:CR=1 FL=1
MVVEYDYKYKIVLVGNTKVGKSNILLRYTYDRFNSTIMPTIGVSFAAKTINLNGKKIRLDIWDTAGQERFRAISKAYYRDAAGIILVYDISNMESFNDCNYWLNLIAEHNGKIPIILVGNKKDLTKSRKISEKDAKLFADNNGLLFIETSALNRDNVNNIFSQIIGQIHSNKNGHSILIENKNNTIKINDNKNKKSYKKYCC